MHLEYPQLGQRYFCRGGYAIMSNSTPPAMFQCMLLVLFVCQTISGLGTSDFELRNQSNLWALKKVKFSKEITGLSQDFEVNMPYNITSELVNEKICKGINILPASKACRAIQRVIIDEKAIKRFDLSSPSLLAEVSGASLVVNEVEGAEFWKKQLESLLLCLNDRGPQKFLNCDVITFLMFAGSRILARQELAWLRAHTTLEWRSLMLQESGVGNPPFKMYADDFWTSTNLLHHVYSYARFEYEVPKVKISSLDLIVEFGGGYGSFARVVMNGGFRGRYVIYDLHPFNLIQKYYLKSLGWKVRTLDEWESYDSGIWMVHDLKTLKKLHLNEGFANNELTMFVAMFSLSEVTDSLKDAFMALGPSSFHNYFIYFQPKWENLSNKDWFANFMLNKRSDLRWTIFEDYGHNAGIDNDTGERKSLSKLAIGTFVDRGAFRAELAVDDQQKLVKVVQSIKTFGAAGFESFKIKGVTYIAAANFWDGKSNDMKAKSVLYRVSPLNKGTSTANGEKNGVSTYMLKFDIVQEFSTIGAHGAEYFCVTNAEVGKMHFLAIPNYYGDTTAIYSFDQSANKFMPFIDLPSRGSGQVEVTQIDGISYLIIAENFAGVLSIYTYDHHERSFRKHQTLKLQGVSSMAVVKCNDDIVLVGASYFAKGSFFTDSTLYYWQNKSKMFVQRYIISKTPGPHDVESINYGDYCGFALIFDRNAKDGESTFLESEIYLYRQSDATFQFMTSVPTDGGHGAEFFETYNDKKGILAIANFGDRSQKRYQSDSKVCEFPQLNNCQHIETHGATDMEHLRVDIGGKNIVDYLIVSNEGDIAKGKNQLSTLYRVL